MTDKRLSLLRDEFRGYFGLLKISANSLSERAIVEKIERDVNEMVTGVFEEWLRNDLTGIVYLYGSCIIHQKEVMNDGYLIGGGRENDSN